MSRHFSPYQTNPTNDAGLFENAIRQIEMLREIKFDVRGRRVLEIGSGWHPLLAMIFISAGARDVILTDVDRLLDHRLVRSAIDTVLSKRAVLVERIGCDCFDRLQIDLSGSNLTKMLERLGITYCVPYQTKQSPTQSIDLIVSCSVLEHISLSLLDTMITDFHRILAPGGAMVHFIDNSDHFEHNDKTISRVNFLRFGDLTWKLCCLNPQNYQNRLRHSEYAHLFKSRGFDIAFEYRESRDREQAEVQAMPLAPRFRGREIQDLAAITSQFVLLRRA